MKNKNNVSNSLDLKVWYGFSLESFPIQSTEVTEFSYFNTDPILDSKMAIEEIIKGLLKCKGNAAPRPDGIKGIFYKNLPPEWIAYFCIFFNKVINSEKVPNEWCRLQMFTLYKKGDPSDPSNYRQISLVNVITKIFTQVLSNRITLWATNNNLLPEFQTGFRQERGCIDNLFALMSLLQIHMLRGNLKLFAIFVDLKGAFPSVDHNLLWKKLKALGMSTKVLNILKDFYCKANVFI